MKAEISNNEAITLIAETVGERSLLELIAYDKRRYRKETLVRGSDSTAITLVPVETEIKAD